MGQPEIDRMLVVFRMYATHAMPAGTLLYGAQVRLGFEGRNVLPVLLADGYCTESTGVYSLTDKGKARLAGIPLHPDHVPLWLRGQAGNKR
jgi:hypothetical protein